MALYLSTTIRLQWQTSVSQHSGHLPNKSVFVGGAGAGVCLCNSKKKGKIHKKAIRKCRKPMKDAQ